MATKDQVIAAANRKSYCGTGGYVNTDGEWCTCTTPEKFRGFLERLGFEVTHCYSTSFSTAIAETADGYKIAYNGHCKKMDVKE